MFALIQDSFLDVSLVLKGFGATQVVQSVNEAIDMFIQPEKLEVRKEGRKEGRKQGRKEARKEGSKQGRKGGRE